MALSLVVLAVVARVAVVVVCPLDASAAAATIATDSAIPKLSVAAVSLACRPPSPSNLPTSPLERLPVPAPG